MFDSFLNTFILQTSAASTKQENVLGLIFFSRSAIFNLQPEKWTAYFQNEAVVTANESS